MSTLALADLQRSSENVIDFQRRLAERHGPPKVSIEEQIKSKVLARLGQTHPNLHWAQAQAVNGWKNLSRTPDYAVDVSVHAAQRTYRPDNNGPTAA